jgi:2,4-dienoyl-CoA reductase-like NADH-dependent reductase (Old Yellow Enzyme family)
MSIHSALFSPLKLRDLTIKNRIFVSPMCQYSCEDGVVTDWHLVHLGSRAVGGAGLVMCEASGVAPEGRISPQDAGIWNQAHVEAWAPITRFIKAQGAVPAMQLAHAGRKASTFAPWRGQGAVTEGNGGWQVVGPSSVPFNDKYPKPKEMSEADLKTCLDDFTFAAELSLQAGFEVVEVHAAHGYLLHEFLSPHSNIRTDSYGGSLENRMRFPLAVCEAVRKAWPEHLPVFVRISATDWKEGGWDVAQSVEFCRRAKALGIDLIDVSSGGNVPDQQIVLGPGYQVPFSSTIRNEAGVATTAVGLISDAVQAEQIVAHGHADSVSLARALLRDPYWPLHAAAELGVQVEWPDQYKRAVVGPLGR